MVGGGGRIERKAGSLKAERPNLTSRESALRSDSGHLEVAGQKRSALSKSPFFTDFCCKFCEMSDWPYVTLVAAPHLLRKLL
jgi:hypothetical protein